MEKCEFEEDSRTLVNNGAKEDEEQDGEVVPMGPTEATEFRAIVARLSFLGQACPDLQYVVKECSREMAKPTVGPWRRLKEIARYLVGRKSLIWRYDWQTGGKFVHCSGQ